MDSWEELPAERKKRVLDVLSDSAACAREGAAYWTGHQDSALANGDSAEWREKCAAQVADRREKENDITAAIARLEGHNP